MSGMSGMEMDPDHELETLLLAIEEEDPDSAHRPYKKLVRWIDTGNDAPGEWDVPHFRIMLTVVRYWLTESGVGD